MELILIADSGSTKTDWILVSRKGQTLTELRSQGLNPFYQDEAFIKEVLAAEVFPHLPEAPQKVFFYGAGCADAKVSEPIKKVLQKQFSRAAVEVASDLLGAARSICQHESGIACILGTGSNNCLYDGEKVIGNIGSLGFWMGDEGSGGHLGKQLVVHYLHGELPDDLGQEFSRQFPEVNRLFILEKAYKQPFPNRYFATFTRFIGRHIQHPFLETLVRESFLTFLGKYVCRHPDAQSYPVGFTGSVAWHFRTQLTEALALKALQAGEIRQHPLPGLVRFHTGGQPA